MAATAIYITTVQITKEYLREVAAGLKELHGDSSQFADPDSEEAIEGARKFLESYKAIPEQVL